MRASEFIVENFADGKNPGRKGLAKRSGVNTKASVSSLRKTAKHSTGEKARMAHWLANMKAGRAKHEDLTDEGWKDWVAGAAMGAAALGASGDAEAAKKKNPDKPAVVQQVKQPAKSTVAAPVKKISPAEAEATLKSIAVKSGITGTELAQFMAQCQHETLNFTKMKEIGGSLDFKKYDPKHAPRKAKILGNTKVGDGSRYAGRGFIQLTGRDNYKKAGDALGLPLEKHPEMVENPVIAAKVAVWYWKNRVQAKVDNFNDTPQVTKYINPGLRGLDSRQSAFKDYKIQLAQR
jgi:predicted chitinase